MKGEADALTRRLAAIVIAEDERRRAVRRARPSVAYQCQLCGADRRHTCKAEPLLCTSCALDLEGIVKRTSAAPSTPGFRGG
jgi:hypothetical protein